jgi:hypothetical protein
VSGDKVVSIHAFETVIRYLGGLLSAYDLSGDELLKQRAEELGKVSPLSSLSFAWWDWARLCLLF